MCLFQAADFLGCLMILAACSYYRWGSNVNDVIGESYFLHSMETSYPSLVVLIWKALLLLAGWRERTLAGLVKLSFQLYGGFLWVVETIFLVTICLLKCSVLLEPHANCWVSLVRILKPERRLQNLIHCQMPHPEALNDRTALTFTTLNSLTSQSLLPSF